MPHDQHRAGIGQLRVPGRQQPLDVGARIPKPPDLASQPPQRQGFQTGLVKKVIPPLVERSPEAIFLMVTNPVDVTTYAALKISGLPRNQLFGSGTVLDSSRLRYLVAEACEVAVVNVHEPDPEAGSQRFRITAEKTAVTVISAAAHQTQPEDDHRGLDEADDRAPVQSEKGRLRPEDQD